MKMKVASIFGTPETNDRGRSYTICPDGFINTTTMWSSKVFFTECFQFALFLPSSIALLAAIPFVLYNMGKYPLPIARVSFGCFKIIQLLLASSVTVLFTGIIAVNAKLDNRLSESEVDILKYISLGLLLFSMIVSIWYSEHLRRRHQPVSELLFLHMFLIFMATLPRFYTLWSRPYTHELQATEFAFVTINVCLTFALLLTYGINLHRLEDSLLADKNPNPQPFASILSLWTFQWVFSTIWMCYRGQLRKPADVFSVHPKDSVLYNFPTFSVAWDRATTGSSCCYSAEQPADKQPALAPNGNDQTPEQVDNVGENDTSRLLGTEPSRATAPPRQRSGKRSPTLVLMSALFSTFRGRLLKSWIFLLINYLMEYSGPILLGFLLRFLASRDAPVWHGFAIAFARTIALVILHVLYERGLHGLNTTGVCVRSVLTAAVYRKALRLSAEARGAYTSGELVNLTSVDINRVMQLVMLSFNVWGALFNFAIALTLLWKQLGLATLTSIACIILMILVNVGLMSFAQKFERMEMMWKDKRLMCLVELFSAIKVVKMYAWEGAFLAKVGDLRQQELSKLARVAFGQGMSRFVWLLSPLFILLTFSTYSRHFLTGFSSGNLSEITPEILDPERIFVSMILFNMIRLHLVLLAIGVSAVIMGIVSIGRIAAFLLAEERSESTVIFQELPADGMDFIGFGEPHLQSGFAIEMRNASFSWSQSGPLVLQNLNLQIPRGWLVAVVGEMGSGKSSLLSACLGDLVSRSHTGWSHSQVILKGSIAYVPQMAWIQKQTLRENISFGDPMEDDASWNRYQAVVSACALEQDIAALPMGDLTEIGERGVNLSGGQRQRVSLARAVYQDCDIYLFDDPLSAVDNHVRKHLFNRVIGPTGLLENKTRLVVTNNFDWLSQADWILVLASDGKLAQSGTYEDISRATSGTFFAYLQNLELEKHLASERTSAAVAIPRHEANTGKFSTTTMGQVGEGLRGPMDEHSRLGTKKMKEEDKNIDVSGEGMVGRFTYDEEVFHGRIHWSTYAYYLCSRGLYLLLVFLLMYIPAMGIQTYGNYWLQMFADDPELISAEQALQNGSTARNETARKHFLDVIHHQTVYYIAGYAVIGIVQALLVFLCILLNIYTSIRASQLIHSDLLERVLHAPAAFFERTPLGRVLNRFSADIDATDHAIPDTLTDTFNFISETMLNILVITVTLRPFGIGLLLVGPVGLICLLVQRVYMPASRQAQRFDALTRSPLLAHFSETAASALGTTVVRAFGRLRQFVDRNDALVDANAKHHAFRFSATCWMDINLMIVCRFLEVTVILVIIANRDKLTPGLAALVLTYAMQAGDSFAYAVMQLALLDTNAVSLERIREYQQVEQEASWESGPGSPPPDDWPKPCCQVTFNKATVCYEILGLEGKSDQGPRNGHSSQVEQDCDRLQLFSEAEEGKTKTPNDPVAITALSSIDLQLGGSPSVRRIGIVGRTGSGKSSLAACLFRLVEAKVTDEDRRLLPSNLASRGPVLVDSVDISRLGLHEFRSRFSILPQEPVVFSGSLRFNLDPFGLSGEQDLWSALEAANLLEWAQSPEIGLDYECGESGNKLSVGQRQLVCMARVVLSCGGRVRLLVLDEATAALDPLTDRLVMQTVVGERFRDATIIIIAHRLSTVMDTDFIVVLDKGRVVEVGRPSELLVNPSSTFAEIYQAGGM